MTLPSPSAGVGLAPFAAEAVLYDPVAGEVHVLNPMGRLVWEACEAGLTEAELIAALVPATGLSAQTLTADVDAYLRQLASSGLVGATEWLGPAARPEPASGMAYATTTMAVLADGVVVRSHDGALCRAIDAGLGSLASDRPVTVCLEATVAENGTIRLLGPDTDERWANVGQFLEMLPSTLNQVAATSPDCLALHAGAVVSPDGVVTVLPATSGSGKSTLTAALVQAGWGYLTDEAAGICPGSLAVLSYAKPLVLDASSCLALGLEPRPSANVDVAELHPNAVVRGPAPRLHRVVLPTYEAGARVQLTRLDTADALVAVAEHALNLRHSGRAGLEALVDLVQQVPCHRLVHGGGPDAVAALTHMRVS